MPIILLFGEQVKVLFAKEIRIESDYKVDYIVYEKNDIWIHYTAKSSTFITLKMQIIKHGEVKPKGIYMYDTEINSVILVEA